MRRGEEGRCMGRCGRRGEQIDTLRVLSYWRRLPAEAFNAEQRADVAAGIRKIGSILPEWNAAIRGDAGSAVGLVLRLRPSFRISARVDLAMTILLNCAFENAGAALVLSYALRRAPLARRPRVMLSNSWLTRKFERANAASRKRPVAVRRGTRKTAR